MMKRAIFIAALCCMVTALLIGCKGSGGKSGENYPLTVTIFTQGNRQQPASNHKMYKYLKDKLNVTIKWDILVGEVAQKRGVMIAGGDYPDMMEINETAFIEAGALIPLEDLIEKHAPNIKEHFKDVWDKLKWEDGHIYYLINYGILHGRDQNPDYWGSALWVQKEVLKDAGYPKVVTMDQYFDLLVNYARKYPTINGQSTIPFTILTYDWRAFCLWNPPNFLAGYPNEGNGTVDPVTHEYKNFFTQDMSKRWFRKLNELNSQGHIDRSAFTDNYDQYIAKLASGRILGIHDQRWQFQDGDNSLRDQGHYTRTMAPLPVVFDASIRPRYRDRPIPNIGRGIGISIKAKDPVRIIRFLNDFMNEEIQRTMEWGIQGEDWQYNSSGVPYRTAEQRANWQNEAWQQQNRALSVRDCFPKFEGTFSDGYPADLNFFYPEREAIVREEDRELWAAYGVTSYPELLDKDPPPNSLWFPTWSMPNPPDGSEAQIALQRCEQTMKKMLPQMILARTADFDRLWTEYVNEMNSNGIARYETYMQQQLNRRIQEWSR
ncbi:MAG: extracellular solute-binding protein [Treponema sp.]|jgi:putative aldouronate transport system substrate-binding protein|nr:extracellular solute-binding protein [Treponema sp.]